MSMDLVSSPLEGPDVRPGASAFLSKLRAGDDAAFAAFVTELTPHLLALAARITQSQAEAEDAVQDAFLSAFRSLAAFDGRSSLRTWMHRITVNACLLRLRRRASRPAVSIESLQPEFSDGFHKEAPKPWGRVTADGGERIEQRDALWRALSELPEEFRDVIVLRDIEGMESTAVAAALGLSDALVRQRLHRGRQALVKLLDPAMAEDVR